MNLYIDIETIPDQSKDAKEVIANEIKHPGNMKKEETINKWREEELPKMVDEQYIKTGLDGTVGEIVCIGYVFDDDPVNYIGRTLEQSEKSILTEFSNIVSEKRFERPGNPANIKWIGHNISGFDLRFIWQRCVINGVKLRIPYDAKPWSNEIYDTLYHWTGLNKAGGSLDRICRAFGMEGKGDIDGSRVWPLIEAGEYHKVFDYCKHDVEMARNLYKRMTFTE